METCGADFRSFRTFKKESAVAALPDDRLFLLEHFSIFDIGEQRTISFFMPFFSNGDVAVHLGDGRKTFLVSDVGEFRIVQRPFLMFSGSSSLQILSSRADDTCRIAWL